MKYVSLDLETTGLLPEMHQVLQISMVVEDTEKEVPLDELPHFTAFINNDRIVGSAYALAMNSWILDILSGRAANDAGYPVFRGIKDASVDASLFLTEHFGKERITVAGKNVAGFDLKFLPSDLVSRFRHRVIDVGSLYLRPAIDSKVPDLAECLRRAGIDTEVPHDARGDALLVIECIRFRGKL